ncbi:hypothetical protein B566_EDAN007945 [Ephemera danica]|nr:hypothetical protein B566_EDAN007945 [Ephemera danica]
MWRDLCSTGLRACWCAEMPTHEYDHESATLEDPEMNSLDQTETSAGVRLRPLKNKATVGKTIVKKQNKFCNLMTAIRKGCTLENIFYKVGKMVGAHPLVMLFVSLLMVTATGLGMLFWREELNNLELFMPPASPVREDAAWVEQHFRDDLRYESIIVVADNVLSMDVLSAIAELDNDVRNINVSGEYSWEDVCARYLSWFQDKGNSIRNDPDFMEILNSSDYKINFNNDCIYQSLLRLWPDKDSIQNLTQEDILRNITNALSENNKELSIFQNVRPLLSGIEYDESGNANEWSPEWELKFIEKSLNTNRSLPVGMKIFAVTERSYNDALKAVLNNNMTTLFSGFGLIIVYVIFMTGRYNCIEHRFILSLLGVSIVGQSIVASYGFCFYTGFFYGPIHPILPFLLLGIGVDDIFVIVQSLDNLTPAEKQMPVAERIGRTLKYAGPSITITSLTDIVAFAVGTTTVMPSLKSFCFFASMGILFLYIFVVLFFVSCVAVDEYRIQSKRDGCLCIQRNNWKPNSCSQRDFQKLFFAKIFCPILLKPPVKQKFDPIWYLNQESYPLKFSDALKQYFPKHGTRAGIYIGGIDYYEEKENLNKLVDLLGKNPYINKETIHFWYKDYQKWLELTEYAPDSEEEFRGYLTEYLLTKEGLSFMKDIKFSRVPFGDYKITASQIPIQHIHMNTTAEQVQAMKSVRDLLNSINLTTGNTSQMVAFSHEYISWTANQVIGEELARNLALTICAVAVVTIILIRNIRTSIWVICCVCFTLVNLVGSMYLFGLTIEISTSIVIILCVGLAVDYSAHIGHKFTTLKGTRDERAKDTLVLIGPAVLNGGISTFLAFVMLSNSDSYIFTTFFKLFLSVVFYGLFHGLFFLPVILSIYGPESSENRYSWNDKLYTVPVENHNGFIPAENTANIAEDVELTSIGPPAYNHLDTATCSQNTSKHKDSNSLPKEKTNSVIQNSAENSSQIVNLLPSNSLLERTSLFSDFRLFLKFIISFSVCNGALHFSSKESLSICERIKKRLKINFNFTKPQNI